MYNNLLIIGNVILLITCVCLIILYCLYIYPKNKKPSKNKNSFHVFSSITEQPSRAYTKSSLLNRNQFLTKFVIENSTALKQLVETNNWYKNKFQPVATFYLQNNYDAKWAFNKVSCQDYLTYQLQFQQKEVFDKFSILKQNRLIYQEYLAELEQIKLLIGNYKNAESNIDKQKLIEVERELLNHSVLKPDLEFHAKVVLTQNGHYSTSKNETFNYKQVINLINRLKDKNGNFYNDRSIYDAIKRVERSKISNKIRFSIYARDNYTCRMCHKRFSAEDLEIDHIIPIAKGGKSNYDNLQTLCRSCNQIKGTDIL